MNYNGSQLIVIVVCIVQDIQTFSSYISIL